MKIKEIIDFTETFAPLDTAWALGDNSGLLVGNENDEVSKILFALDITGEVVKEAEALGAQLIISHHPVIFSPIKSLDTEDVPYLLARKNIAALCLHLNLDLAKDCGVNICLANALELKNVEMIDDKYAAVGELENELSPENFALHCKEKLGADGIRYIRGKYPIKKVVVAGGAAGDMFSLALKVDAQAFVTGEIKHHETLNINRHKLTAVEGGHFKTEDTVFFPLIAKIKSRFPNIEYYKSEVFSDNFLYI